MNRSWLAPLMVSFFTGLPAYAASANAVDFGSPAEIADIVSLSKTSEAQDQACVAFLKRLKTATRDSLKTEHFVTRTSTLQALRALPSYPGTSLASSEALERFMDLVELPSTRNSSELRLALNRLSDCHAAELFGVWVRLIHKNSLLHLYPREKQELSRVLLSFLRRETFGGARKFFQVQKLVELLARASHGSLLRVPASYRPALADLSWKTSKILREQESYFRDLELAMSSIPSDSGTGQEADPVLEKLRWQLDQADELREDLQLVLEQTDTGGAIPESLEFGPMLMMR